MDNSNFSDKLIDDKTAKLLCSNFIGYKASVIERQYKKQDANAIWYSLEDLEAYIAFVKKSGEELGIKVNGLRIYFGSYPNETTVKHAGLNTVFLTPTTDPVKPLGLKQGDDELSQPIDAKGIKSLNYGGIGNPPQIIFEP